MTQSDIPVTVRPTWLEPEPTELEHVLLGEFTHRIANDFQVACSTIRLQLRDIADANTALALDDLARRLEALGRIQRLLLCPTSGAAMELGLAMRELCEAIWEARFGADTGGVELEIGPEVIPLASPRAWRILLVVTELLTNAARHGLSSESSPVRVSLTADAQDIVCVVRNEGACRPGAVQGYGTHVVLALVSELDGMLEASADERGTIVRFLAPRFPLGCVAGLLPRGGTDTS